MNEWTQDVNITVKEGEMVEPCKQKHDGERRKEGRKGER